MLSQLKVGDEIEYQLNTRFKARPKIKKGAILQITDKVISIQGDKYRSTINVHDLASGEAKITKLRGAEFELSRINTDMYDDESLKALYVKHKCSISRAAQEINWNYNTLKTVMVRRGLIDENRKPLFDILSCTPKQQAPEQAEQPDPAAATNQEPDQDADLNAEEPVTDSMPDREEENKEPIRQFGQYKLTDDGYEIKSEYLSGLLADAKKFEWEKTQNLVDYDLTPLVLSLVYRAMDYGSKNNVPEKATLRMIIEITHLPTSIKLPVREVQA